MRITITESQYKNIIIENRNSSIENELKESDSFFKNLVKSAKQQLNLDLTFLVTWGATIGGFMHPISEFTKNAQIEISNQDLSLITIGCVLTYFTDNKKMLFEVLEKIKEKKLISEFNLMLKQCDKLKSYFLNFVEGLNLSIYNISMMIGYTFLIPLLPKLLEISKHGLSPDEISEISKRISLYFGSTLSSKLIYELVKKTIKKFKSSI